MGTARWDLHSTVSGADYQFTVDLPARAPAALTTASVNVAASSGASPKVADGDASCTGTIEAPTAPAGKVCIYVVSELAATGLQGTSTNQLADRAFRIQWLASHVGSSSSDLIVDIVWAYTAP